MHWRPGGRQEEGGDPIMLAQPVLSSANFHYSANLGGNSQLPSADGSNLVFCFIARDQRIQLDVILTFLGSFFDRRIDARGGTNFTFKEQCIPS